MLLASYYTTVVPLTLVNLSTKLPALILLCTLSMLLCLMVPLMVAALFSGSTGGHGSVSGMAALALRFIG